MSFWLLKVVIFRDAFLGFWQTGQNELLKWGFAKLALQELLSMQFWSHNNNFTVGIFILHWME